jgi:hypothetical protein
MSALITSIQHHADGSSQSKKARKGNTRNPDCEGKKVKLSLFKDNMVIYAKTQQILFIKT